MSNFISASEVSDFVYCARSFYLKQKLGIKNLESDEIRDGLAYHQHHGWQVALYSFLKKVAILFFIILLFLIFLFFLKTKF